MPLRRTSFLAIVAVLALVLVPPATARTDNAGASAVTAALSAAEQGILAGINSARRARGLAPLRVARGLARAADVHARSMTREGYFSHNSADGTSASARIRRFYRGSAVGETILWRSPSVTPKQALRMWLESPSHRAILLSSTFDSIGLGAVHVSSAPGTFGGRPVTVVVADFGSL